MIGWEGCKPFVKLLELVIQSFLATGDISTMGIFSKTPSPEMSLLSLDYLTMYKGSSRLTNLSNLHFILQTTRRNFFVCKKHGYVVVNLLVLSPL